jgi:hypothetical protein
LVFSWCGCGEADTFASCPSFVFMDLPELIARFGMEETLNCLRNIEYY